MKVCVPVKNHISVCCYFQGLEQKHCNMRLTHSEQSYIAWFLYGRLWGGVKNKLQEMNLFPIILICPCKNMAKTETGGKGVLWNDNHISDLWLHPSGHVNGVTHRKWFPCFKSAKLGLPGFFCTKGWRPADPLCSVCCLHWLIFFSFKFSSIFFENEDEQRTAMAGNGFCRLGRRPPTRCLSGKDRRALSAPCWSHAEFSKSRLARHLENFHKKIFFIFAGIHFFQQKWVMYAIRSCQNVS